MNTKHRVIINKPKNKTCDICKNEFSLYSFSSHIKHTHKLTSDEYANQYGEFRAPKRLPPVRNIKRLTCQLCQASISSVGMFTHLRDSHKMTVDDYTIQFGEYRPSKIRQIEYQSRLYTMDTEDTKICLICKQKFASGILLGYHIKNIHNIKKKDYIFKYVFNEIRPLCGCGCGRKVKLLSYHPYKVDFVSGHNSVGEGNVMFGKHFSNESKMKMSLSAIERINIHTSVKLDTKPELKFKSILDTLHIKYKHPHVINLGPRYASIDFYLSEYDMLIEVDGDYWHPQELKKLNFHTLPNVISDGERRGLNNLFRIKASNMSIFEKCSKTKESAVEYLRNNGTIFNPPLAYKQPVINKEFFQNCINKKGQKYLKSFNWLLKKFIRTFQPEFPYPDLEESLAGAMDKLSRIDVCKVYKPKTKEFSNNISTIGHNYLKHHFHSFWKSKFNGNPSPSEAWLDDKIMQEVIDYRIGCNNSGEVFDFSLHQLVRGLSARRITISFFKPLLAAAIYKHYLGTVKSPVVLDPCCGFGGRLLGFKSQYPNGKYIGCEPNVDTYNELMELRRTAKWEDSVEIYNCKFEDFTNWRNNKFDLVFTSIPYYDVEIYSNPVEYASFDDWRNTFIKSIEHYSGMSCYINAPKELCNKLGWITVDSYIVSNRSHFDKKEGKKKDLIIKL
jgi:hypothetical protein